MSRVVVAGAGVGGLAVAARLAHAGHAVTVLERDDVVGGKLGTYRRDGLSFDTGPSLLTLPDVLRDTFDATGGWPKGLVLKEIRPLHRYRLADGSWTDSDSLGPAWDRVLARGRRMWEASQPFLHATRLLPHLRDLPAIAPGRTIASVAPRGPLRDVLWRYATYSGSDPRRAPGVLASIAYAEHAFGGWHVEGGLRRIVDALLDRCRALGVAVETGVEVTGLASGGVATTAGVVPGTVVSDLDAAVTLPWVGRRPRGRRSYGGLAILLPGAVEVAHHTVRFPRHYEAEFEALRRGAMPADPAIYTCCPGDGTTFVLVNAPDTVPDGTAERVLERLGAQPSWYEKRHHRAIYGTALDSPLAPLLRTRNEVRGLHLVGGTVHPGGGIPLVLLSAAIVARRIGPA